MFKTSSLWLSPITQENTSERLIRKVNYQQNDNLVVDTPPLEIEDFILIADPDQYKILVKAKLVNENAQFRNVIDLIDKKMLTDAGFVGSQRFWPTIDSDGTFYFFIPIYNKEINVLILGTDERKKMSLTQLSKGMKGRMMLILSHIESTSQLFFPVWNVVQIRLL